VKKIELTFLNKSKLLLHILLKRSGDSGSDKFEVKRKYKVRLFPGRYQICAYYCSSNIELTFNFEQSKIIDDIPSPDDSKYRAKLILLDYPKKSVRITCMDKISIANLVEGK
jgi:hypothetical protein